MLIMRPVHGATSDGDRNHAGGNSNPGDVRDIPPAMTNLSRFVGWQWRLGHVATVLTCGCGVGSYL